MAVNKELGGFSSLPGEEGENGKGQYEAGMKLQMFQFIFISMAFHYGVEMNGYKTTSLTERKLGVVAQAVKPQIMRQHTRSSALNVLRLREQCLFAATVGVTFFG